MAGYKYTAQNSKTGKRVKGQMEADSPKEVRSRLRKEGLLVIDIKEDRSAEGATSDASFWSKLNRKPPSGEDIALATKQLSILLRSGVEADSALRALVEQVENAELRSVYTRIRDLVAEGQDLATAHKEFPAVFDNIYVSMLNAGLKANSLVAVLKRLSDFLFYTIELKRKIVGAFMYPIIMLSVSGLVIIYLFVSVLPKISKALATMKVTLPWYTVMVNNISKFLQDYGLIMAPIILGIGGLFYFWIKTEAGRKKWHEFLYNAPVVGQVIQKVTLSRFANTLAILNSTGVKTIEALKLSRNVVDNAVYEEALDDCVNMVQDGLKLAQALSQTGKFPAMLIHMVRTGEKAGNVDQMLEEVVRVYDDEVDHQISVMTKSIQPIMLIMLSGIVVLIMACVMGPMFEAMQNINKL